MTSILGFLGGLAFALCGVPAAYHTVRAGRSLGTPISTAWLIFGGGILMYLYLLLTYGFNLLLAVNYAVEVGSWGVVLKYHYLPRSR